MHKSQAVLIENGQKYWEEEIEHDIIQKTGKGLAFRP